MNSKMMMSGLMAVCTLSGGCKSMAGSGSTNTHKGQNVLVLDDNTGVETRQFEAAMTQSLVLTHKDGFDCGSQSSFYMREPIAEVEVKSPQQIDLAIAKFTGDSKRIIGWMVMGEDGHYACKQGFTSNTYNFTPGKYKIFATWGSGNMDVTLKEVREARPVIVLNTKTYGAQTSQDKIVIDAGHLNPLRTKPITYTSGYVDYVQEAVNGAVNVSCNGYERVSTKPVFEVEVKEGSMAEPADKSGYKRGVSLITTRDDMIWQVGKKCHQRYTFNEPGTYSVYAVLKEGVDEGTTLTPYLFHAQAQANPPFNPPKHNVDRLDDVLVIDGEIIPDVLMPPRMCKDNKARTFYNAQSNWESDVVLESNRPVNTLRALVISQDEQALTAHGVNTTMTPETLSTSPAFCARPPELSPTSSASPIKLGTLDGTMALHVTHGQRPHKYKMFVWSEQTQIDPLLVGKEPPARIDSLYEAQIPRYYPLFEYAGTNASRTWKALPSSLRVYMTEDVTIQGPKSAPAGAMEIGELADLQLKTNEPVLLVSVLGSRQNGKPGKVRVLTSDFWLVEIDGFQLTTKAPSKPVIPGKGRAFRNMTIKGLEETASDKTLKKGDNYRAMYDKAYTCFDTYWADHDGATISKYDRVTYYGGRIVAIDDLGEVLAKKAMKACKFSKMEREEASYVKALLKDRGDVQASTFAHITSTHP